VFVNSGCRREAGAFYNRAGGGEENSHAKTSASRREGEVFFFQPAAKNSIFKTVPGTRPVNQPVFFTPV